MLKYILKRIFLLIPVIMGVTLIVFLIMQLAPGDPAQLILGEFASKQQVAQLREQMGLNDSLLIRYFKYMLKFFQGDFGTSYISQRSVASEVFARLPYSINLSLAAAIISIVIAIPMGIMAAVKQNKPFDNISMIISLFGISMPIFWLALLMIMQFSYKWGWFPVAGAASWKSYVLPSSVLAFINMATIARTTRSSMLETIRQDYIRTARSKGVPKRDVIRNHAFRNALIPTITVIGIQMGSLVGGAVLTEVVFAWPGIGRLMVQSINYRDTPMVMGCIIILTITFSVLNLVVDLLYGFVDPRIKSMYS